MHGDFTLNPLFSRDTVSRVLLQQGRVQLDSDSNEQTEVLLRTVRTAVRDIIGPHGGVGTAFAIKLADGAPQRFRIGWGHYYVDGILAANETPPGEPATRTASGASGPGFPPDGLLYSEQPSFPTGIHQGQPHFDVTKELLVYLDVWERHISAAEDDSLREVALLGPDTASRAVIVWQVRILEKTDDNAAFFDDDTPYEALHKVLDPHILLRAQAVKNTDTDPCVISPESRYRGDNRLYRVEIHDTGVNPPTFKWSTDNGSIAYPVRNIEGTTIELDSLGRDDRTAISIGDWVEVVDDESVLLGKAYDLVQVIAVDRSRLEITVNAPLENPIESGSARRTILRRWATKPIEIRLGDTPTSNWFDLADGVSVQFSVPDQTAPRHRTGDYWLIPARAATGDVLWPKEGNVPAPLPPHGVEHHYAPLAFWGNDKFTEARKTYEHLAK